MFSDKDLIQIKAKGSTVSKVEKQIDYFKKDFPFMPLKKAATPSDGIIILSDEELKTFSEFYEKKAQSLKIVKFVPASGAASRMFKSLFAAMEVVGPKQRAMINGVLNVTWTIGVCALSLVAWLCKGHWIILGLVGNIPLGICFIYCL